MKKANKYNAQKTEVDGILFDSKKEAEYYLKLKKLEEEGEIFQLDRQIKFQLQPGYINHEGKKVREILYIADFVYLDKDNKRHCVDVKGIQTSVFKLKKKIFEYVYPEWTIEIV